MHLLIMRHGEALSGVSDFDRPLSPGGLDGVRSVASRLGDHVTTIDKILCSPLTRTIQTAELVNNFSYCNVTVDLCYALAPGADCEDVVKKLKSQRADTLLLVSHQPLVGNMIDYLTRENLSITVGMVACIKLESFDSYGGELKWVIQ